MGEGSRGGDGEGFGWSRPAGAGRFWPDLAAREVWGALAARIMGGLFRWFRVELDYFVHNLEDVPTHLMP